MRADVLAELLARLDRSKVAPAAIAEVRQIVQEVRVSHGLAASLQEQRMAFAREHLAAGRPRTEIRDRLMCRFSIGESQAYRDIQAALKIVPRNR